MSVFRTSILSLPCPVSLSIWWNFGSCLGLVLASQFLSGLLLSIHYCCDTSLAFASVSHILRDVQYGWFLRSLHANGASFFFLAIYLHVGRGIYYGSYTLVLVWFVGVCLLLLSMGVAFLGYTLPWGQISFWGATVITNLLSAVPYFGDTLVVWLWGGFSVDAATLMRFYSLHFLLPFLLSGLASLHIWYLHFTGSNNPLGVSAYSDIISFHSFFSYKDVIGFMILYRIILFVVLFFPTLLMEADNFIPANAMSTPPHIVPEWYFLFAYAILRTIHSKLGGVIALFSSLLILASLSLSHYQAMKGLTYYGPVKIFYWAFVTVFFLLTLFGGLPMEPPYRSLVPLLTLYYFGFFFFLGRLRKFWDKLLF